MTWSERQALAKKRAEEEEANSRAASSQVPAGLSSRWKAPEVASAITTSSNDNDDDQQGEDEWEAV